MAPLRLEHQLMLPKEIQPQLAAPATQVLPQLVLATTLMRPAKDQLHLGMGQRLSIKEASLLVC